MMTVRISVAKSESMPWMPILANIAVSAAKQADRTAQKNQSLGMDSVAPSLYLIWVCRLSSRINAPGRNRLRGIGAVLRSERKAWR